MRVLINIFRIVVSIIFVEIVRIIFYDVGCFIVVYKLYSNQYIRFRNYMVFFCFCIDKLKSFLINIRRIKFLVNCKKNIYFSLSLFLISQAKKSLGIVRNQKINNLDQIIPIFSEELYDK